TNSLRIAPRPRYTLGQAGAQRRRIHFGSETCMTAVTANGAVKPASMTRVVLTALAASSIEWYDFFIYGTAAALVFPKLFFSHDLPPYIAQLASFSTFAVGFIARPIGGVIFGHFGDKYGRKRALVTAMLIMGL